LYEGAETKKGGGGKRERSFVGGEIEMGPAGGRGNRVIFWGRRTIAEKRIVGFLRTWCRRGETDGSLNRGKNFVAKGGNEKKRGREKCPSAALQSRPQCRQEMENLVEERKRRETI